MTFKDIIEAYQGSDVEEKVKALAKKAPLHKVILNMSILHHPNPMQAQVYRIPKIWRGDVETTVGKSLMECNADGPLAFVVTKIVYDKHAGEVAAGRLFSGTIKQGMDVYMNGAKKVIRVQQVSIYNGAKRELIDSAPSGNIVGVVGLKNVFSGETVSSEQMTEFEAIKHIFDPVVTKAIEAKNPIDLPKLVEVLRQVNKEDPTITIEINEETGEHLISGMGELHLEVIENRIRSEKGVQVTTSPPIVVFRETVTRKSPEAMEGKSPNKHNKLYFQVEPLEPEVGELLKKGELNEGRCKKDDRNIWEKLQKLGWDTKVARSVRDIYNGNMFIDETRGEVHIHEIMEMLQDMLRRCHEERSYLQ